MKKSKFSQFIKSFDFETLFNELGWDNFSNKYPISTIEQTFNLQGIAEKKSFVILQCLPDSDGKIPVSNIRKQIQNKIADKKHVENLIIYSDKNKTQQIWQLAIKEPNKPKQIREFNWYASMDSEILFQRLRNLVFTLDEHENITIIDVKQRISENFAKNTETVTKKFYTEFKKHHTDFLDFIEGIEDHIPNKENAYKQWYASLMLNRLMFCYFIQKQGFLDQNINYLQEKLVQSKELSGNDNFYSFYKSFLLKMFHDGLASPEIKRKNDSSIPYGKIPYLNGGLFDIHKLENDYRNIDVKDEAFQKIFDFFDKWNWHLDTKIEATGKDINPDVIGFIFEKYINDRAAMGAYYTKEDITEYIGKNTIIPFLFDEVKRNYKQAFSTDSEMWKMLKNSGDTYIYDAVKHGISNSHDLFSDLPDDVKSGFLPELENQIVTETTYQHLWEIRKTWNQKAPQEIALPTETYRELIERRKRYADLKSKIEKGEISEINDFITYNLNIIQFAQDVIQNSEDPKFIKEIFEAIKKVTILDPTCGSGAFLFAAMNILEPLYEACIESMEQFVAENAGKNKFFESTLTDINSDKHPNRKYYIYKSIILNNLYGVDIMHEAVEIAKLRLFLKLVATVEPNPRKDNYGLEPLPDIDFNIRAGNTLVGFATENELFETIKKVDNLFAPDILADFKEETGLVSKAFQHFQNAQLVNDQNSESHRNAKTELTKRLSELNEKLNNYLARNYGKDAKKMPKAYNEWLVSHQPFNWFAEFYKIIVQNGGFDVIIGNPPYVVYTDSSTTYSILNYSTIKCSNLYAFSAERSFNLIKKAGKFGFIIPNSSISADKLTPLQKIFTKNKNTWISNFSWRPSKLFEGADMLLAIVISGLADKATKTYSSQYYKWYNEYRNSLFDNISYNNSTQYLIEGSIPKIPNILSVNILSKILKQKNTVNNYKSETISKNLLYYFRAVQYWVKILDKIPMFREDGIDKVTGEMKPIYFKNIEDKYIFLSLFSSNLYFIYYIIWSSCQVMNSRDFNINFDKKNLDLRLLNYLLNLGKKLQDDYQLNSKIIERSYSKKGRNFIMEKQHFKISKSKPIIDEIDTVLAEHYGFTEEELDFIINYDIKYRMGKSLYGEADTEEENEEEE